MSQSPLFVKTEVFMAWLLEHTRKYPKHERFRLAKRIEDALFEFHDALLWAASQPAQAASHLASADHALVRLRSYLRLGLELHYSSASQYEYISQNVVELGKLLGGWLKMLKTSVGITQA